MEKCKIHGKDLPCEDCEAEKLKKEELYNPYTFLEQEDEDEDEDEYEDEFDEFEWSANW